MVSVPALMLDSWERRWSAFDFASSLVADPAADLANDRTGCGWSPEERQTFMLKFIEHPKDFATIASYLPHRSVADCVVFFYKNQKLDEFANVRRKQQLKKRRLQAQTKTGLLGSMYRQQQQLAQQQQEAQVHPLALQPPLGYDALAPAAAAEVHLPPTTSSHPETNGGRGGRGRGAGRGRGRGRSRLMTRPPPETDVAIANPPPAEPTTADAGDAADPEDDANRPDGGASHGNKNWDDLAFLEAVRLHGKDMRAISQHLGNKSEGAVKVYYGRHKKRLELESLLVERDRSLRGGEGEGDEDINAIGQGNALHLSGCGPVRLASVSGASPLQHLLKGAAVAAATGQAAAASSGPAILNALPGLMMRPLGDLGTLASLQVGFYHGCDVGAVIQGLHFQREGGTSRAGARDSKAQSSAESRGVKISK